MGKSIILCIIVLFCAAVFIAIGIWALVRKDPMHFWAGSAVRPEEICDIPAYNRANGTMWLVFGGIYFVLAFLSFLSPEAVGIALIVVTLAGIPILILLYERIYYKYKT